MAGLGETALLPVRPVDATGADRGGHSLATKKRTGAGLFIHDSLYPLDRAVPGNGAPSIAVGAFLDHGRGRWTGPACG